MPLVVVVTAAASQPESRVVTAEALPICAVMLVRIVAAAAAVSATTVTVIIVLLGGESVNVSVTDETGTPRAVAIMCAIAVRSAAEIDADSPSSCTTVSAVVDAPPASVLAAAVVVPSRICIVLRIVAATADVAEATCTVIIVLLGGTSVKESATDETVTPSAVAMVCAICARSASEYVEERPDS